MYCVEKEISIIDEIKKHRCLVKKLEHELRLQRKKKTQAIRDMYFKKRMKQTEIAKVMVMRQGNVSRIISGQIGDRYYHLKE